MDTASFGSFDDEMEVEIEWNAADKNSTNAHDSSTSAGRKTVPCGECGTVCRDAFRLAQHAEGHALADGWQCAVCGVRFNREARKRNRHERQVHAFERHNADLLRREAVRISKAQLAEMINVGFKLADVQRDALSSLRADGHAEATAAELRAHTPAKTPQRVCKAHLRTLRSIARNVADVQRDAVRSLAPPDAPRPPSADYAAYGFEPEEEVPTEAAARPRVLPTFDCPQCAVACRVAASLQPRADGAAAANDAWQCPRCGVHFEFVAGAPKREPDAPQEDGARAEALAIPKALLAEVFAGAPLADRTPARRVHDDDAARFDEELRSVEFRTDEARVHANVSQSSKRLLRNSCPECGLTINSMLFPAHLQAHALKKGWQCSLCGIRLPSQRQRREHEAQVHHFRRCKFDQSRKEAIRIDDEQLRCFRSPGSNFRAVQRGAVKSIAEALGGERPQGDEVVKAEKRPPCGLLAVAVHF
ncbi:hypothetical protein M3Y99_00109400 [Aphelenchoides fujianensis]|nr:hypothetical protein M3Y99_00109400 [Aphelenchoides fujianensis]